VCVQVYQKQPDVVMPFLLLAAVHLMLWRQLLYAWRITRFLMPVSRRTLILVFLCLCIVLCEQ